MTRRDSVVGSQPIPGTTTARYSIRQQPGANPAFFRLALFVNQLKRIRRNLERIKTPGGSIPRVSPRRRPRPRPRRRHR